MYTHTCIMYIYRPLPPAPLRPAPARDGASPKPGWQRRKENMFLSELEPRDPLLEVEEFLDMESSNSPHSRVIKHKPMEEPFPLGATVETHSLTTGASYNGMCGKVLCKSGDRVRVEFGEGDCQDLKPERERRSRPLMFVEHSSFSTNYRPRYVLCTRKFVSKI